MFWFKKKCGHRNKANLYYELLAGGARTKLLESVVNFNLAELISENSPILETDLIKTLGLHPLRAKKWLFLLVRENFLHRKKTNDGYIYSLGSVLNTLFVNNDLQWWFFKQMVYSWQTIAYEKFYDVLKGGKVNITYQWPPRNEQESISIENWMTRTTTSPLIALYSAIDFNDVSHLLDIGGGDGTIACALASKFPQLKVTVYNLPKACELARIKIDKADLANRVHVIEGDFLVDDLFPVGYDLILFSRVLCDWSPETAKKLLLKAYESIEEGGQVAICEAFQENNKAFALAWEFRYIFWDEFETEVFKSSLTYKKILIDIGFKINSLSKTSNQSIYSVLIADKI